MKAWTLLFDIDGTIMTSDHAGTSAMAETAKELFGVEQIGPLKVHGRCDRGILAELFQELGVSYEQHHEAFCRRYYQNLPDSLVRNQGRLLPGIKTLLETLHQRDDVALGILTGNLQQAAEIKLKYVGVDQYFRFGGYGDQFADRNEVAKQAAGAAEATIGAQFSGDQVWVIGDTPNDIRCARAIGAKVLAVETGGGSPEALKRAQPDLLLPDLADCRKWLGLLKTA